MTTMLPVALFPPGFGVIIALAIVPVTPCTAADTVPVGGRLELGRVTVAVTVAVELAPATRGASDARRVFQGYDSGAVDFLYKPIDPHILKSKVGVFVELEHQKMALARELAKTTETLRFNEMFTAMLGHDLRGECRVGCLEARAVDHRPGQAPRSSPRTPCGPHAWAG